MTASELSRATGGPSTFSISSAIIAPAAAAEARNDASDDWREIARGYGEFRTTSTTPPPESHLFTITIRYVTSPTPMPAVSPPPPVPRGPSNLAIVEMTIEATQALKQLGFKKLTKPSAWKRVPLRGRRGSNTRTADSRRSSTFASNDSAGNESRTEGRREHERWSRNRSSQVPNREPREQAMKWCENTVGSCGGVAYP